MPECTECGSEMASEPGGLRGLLGLGSVEGYACSGCGATLCVDCKQRKSIDAIGGSEVRCGVCGGRWERR